MIKINIFSKTGEIIAFKEVKENNLHKSHNQLIFDAVNVEVQNKRIATAHTKTKAEVSGTGKKPYKQKHTGRARQGSRRNPQFVGGGLAFGPKNNRNYSIKINKKISLAAKKSSWVSIFKSNNISILSNNIIKDFFSPKTKQFMELLKNLKLLNLKILFIVSNEDNNLFLSAKNINNVIVKFYKYVSTRDLLNQNYVLLTENAWDLISETNIFN